MSTAEKMNAKMFFTNVYVAQQTDDRLQQANKNKLRGTQTCNSLLNTPNRN